MGSKVKWKGGGEREKEIKKILISHTLLCDVPIKKRRKKEYGVNWGQLVPWLSLSLTFFHLSLTFFSRKKNSYSERLARITREKDERNKARNREYGKVFSFGSENGRCVCRYCRVELAERNQWPQRRYRYILYNSIQVMIGSRRLYRFSFFLTNRIELT